MKCPVKYSRVAPLVQELAEGDDVAVGRVGPGEEALRGAVELLHLDEHAQEARIRHRSPARANTPPIPRAPCVLQAAALAAHRHAHVGGAGLDAELAEETQQVRVRAVVVHDEPGVDRDDAVVGGEHVVRVRVATEARLGLEERHVVARAAAGTRRSGRTPRLRSRRRSGGPRSASSRGTERAPRVDRERWWGRSSGSPRTIAATNSVASRCHSPARNTMPWPLRGHAHARGLGGDAGAARSAKRAESVPLVVMSRVPCRIASDRPASWSTGSPSGSHGASATTPAHVRRPRRTRTAARPPSE